MDDVHLETARRGFNGGNEATWVEQCSCPEGFVGQFCESCDHGYKRDPANGGAFSACVPCTCHNHSDACDVNTGKSGLLLTCQIIAFKNIYRCLVIFKNVKANFCLF